MVAMITPYLRGKVWCLRMSIPEELRAHMGRREFKASLKTSDMAEAKRRAKLKGAEWDTLIAQARGGQRDITHRDIPFLTNQWLVEALRSDDEERQDGGWETGEDRNALNNRGIVNPAKGEL